MDPATSAPHPEPDQPEPEADQPEPDDTATMADNASSEPASEGEFDDAATEADRRLLARARELGSLDLADRPDAIERLDAAIVDELKAIEDL